MDPNPNPNQASDPQPFALDSFENQPPPPPPAHFLPRAGFFGSFDLQPVPYFPPQEQGGKPAAEAAAPPGDRRDSERSRAETEAEQAGGGVNKDGTQLAEQAGGQPGR